VCVCFFVFVFVCCISLCTPITGICYPPLLPSLPRPPPSFWEIRGRRRPTNQAKCLPSLPPSLPPSRPPSLALRVIIVHVTRTSSLPPSLTAHTGPSSSCEIYTPHRQPEAGHPPSLPPSLPRSTHRPTLRSTHHVLLSHHRQKGRLPLGRDLILPPSLPPSLPSLPSFLYITGRRLLPGPGIDSFSSC